MGVTGLSAWRVRVSWCAGAVCVEYGIRCVTVAWRGRGARRVV